MSQQIGALCENACELKRKWSILERDKQGRNKEVRNQLNRRASVLYECIENQILNLHDGSRQDIYDLQNAKI